MAGTADVARRTCAICWEEGNEADMVREVVGVAAEPESGKRDRTTHWWRCREECVPRAKQVTVPEWLAEPEKGRFLIPALFWLEMRDKAELFVFWEGDRRRVCRTGAMKEHGRAVEMDGLWWSVPMIFWEEG